MLAELVVLCRNSELGMWVFHTVLHSGLNWNVSVQGCPSCVAMVAAASVLIVIPPFVCTFLNCCVNSGQR